MGEKNNGEFIILPFFGKHTVAFLLGWLGLTMFITFTLFYLLHPHTGYIVDGQRQIPTISLTGSYFPGNLIFTFGLHVAAIYVAYVFTAVYVSYENKFENIEEDLVKAVNPNLFFFCKSNIKNKSSLRKWNLRMLRVGLTSAFFMALVGTCSLTINEKLHGTLAFIMFICAVVHMFGFYNNIHRYLGVPRGRVLMHHVACVICVPFNMLMYIVAFLINLNCSSDPCKKLAVDMGPIVEFTTVIALSLYIIQFSPDIENTYLVLCSDKSPRRHINIDENDIDDRNRNQSPNPLC